MSVCVLTVVGNLGQDPESREAGSSTVCSFSIAHNRKSKGNEETDWYNVSAWGRLGEVCQEYLQKGSQVVVSGSLAQRGYTDKDNNDRISLDIRANDVQFVGKTKEEGGEHKESVAAAAGDDDIPF